MKPKTQKEFCENCSIPAPLIRAVVRQFGGWESFKRSAHDVSAHGIDGGFCGFLYHSDTVPFAQRNINFIIRYAMDVAAELGEQSAYQMIAQFRCLNGMSVDEVINAIHKRRGNGSDRAQVLNGLAWFAAEEVCCAFENLSET